jgi:hypothetical protein
LSHLFADLLYNRLREDVAEARFLTWQQMMHSVAAKSSSKEAINKLDANYIQVD